MDTLEKTKLINPFGVSTEHKSDAPKVEAPPKKEFKRFNKVDPRLVKTEFAYPFEELEVGQAFLVPLEHPNTMDTLVFAVHKQVLQYKLANSQIEYNEEGDEVLETVTIRSRLRNADGSFKLGPDGKPKTSASTVSRNKLIGPSFMIKAVHKDEPILEEAKTIDQISAEAEADDEAKIENKDKPAKATEGAKADYDGVLVIRVD